MKHDYIQQECPISDALKIRADKNRHEVCLVKQHDLWTEIYIDDKKSMDEFINELVEARNVVFGKDKDE